MTPTHTIDPTRAAWDWRVGAPGDGRDGVYVLRADGWEYLHDGREGEQAMAKKANKPKKATAKKSSLRTAAEKALASAGWPWGDPGMVHIGVPIEYVPAATRGAWDLIRWAVVSDAGALTRIEERPCPGGLLSGARRCGGTGTLMAVRYEGRSDEGGALAPHRFRCIALPDYDVKGVPPAIPLPSKGKSKSKGKGKRKR